jgi:hypothetical protein
VAFKTANEGDDVIMDDPATLTSTSSENLDLETHGKFSYIFNFFNFFYQLYGVDENSDNRPTDLRNSVAAIVAAASAATSMIEDVNIGKFHY